jgi:L-arabinokinase
MTGRDDQNESHVGDARAWLGSRADFFDPHRTLLVTRAPGRLDVMGGIADYSGSVVLELPLAVATWVAVQVQDKPTLVIESVSAGEGRINIPLEDITPAAPLPYREAHLRMTRDPERAWAAYVAGALVVLQHEFGHRMRHGARVLVGSTVPIGAGVSSSAALDVAAFEALAALAGVPLDVRSLALAAQKVENFVVGAPCGVMDQMTAAAGRRDHLLELLCQPAEVVGHLPLPATLEIFGVDSGLRHAVAGADYGSVRAAAFMGYRIVADAAGLTARDAGPGRVEIDDPLYRGYLANVTPDEWGRRFRDAVPERLDGAAFLARYGGSTDAATTIDPARRYAVRAAAEHPILEHDRVRRFRALLADGVATAEARAAMGALMYESHASYSACGLGSDGTDRLVELVRAAGPAAGLHGAKITGGGSGGTVAILADRGSRAAVDAIAQQYRAETGHAATIFAGSSSGARAFGVRELSVSPAPAPGPASSG